MNYLIEGIKAESKGIKINKKNVDSVQDLKNSLSSQQFFEDINNEKKRINAEFNQMSNKYNSDQSRIIPKIKEKLKLLNW